MAIRIQSNSRNLDFGQSRFIKVKLTGLKKRFKSLKRVDAQVQVDNDHQTEFEVTIRFEMGKRWLILCQRGYHLRRMVESLCHSARMRLTNDQKNVSA